MPIKVLHLISTLDVGGTERNLHRLLDSIHRDVFMNEVVCMREPGTVARKIEKSGVPVHSLKMKQGIPDIRAVLRLRLWVNLMRPHIIQCWMYHANLLGLTLLRPKTTVWNIRCSDMDLSFYPLMYRWSVKAGAKLSPAPEAVIVNSYAGRKAHEERGYHPKKWIIIPNGFDTTLFKPDSHARTQFRNDLDIAGDALVIGIIGRLDPMKDHATFFAAARLFQKKYSGTHFILAGRGLRRDDPKIKSMLGPGRNNKQYHFLDEREDIESILPALDIATSSSLSEGIPNAIGEAMSCGIPCVATDAGDTGLLMGDTGLLVNRQSPQELCRAWDTIARMAPDSRLEMGLRGRDRILRYYSQEKTTRSYEGLYQTIVRDQAV